MTTFLITEDGEGHIDTERITQLLSKVNPSTDSVVTDCGNVVHQPLDSDAQSTLEAI